MPHRCEHMFIHSSSFGPGFWPGTLFSTMSTAFWIGLSLVLVWALWHLLSPYLMPAFADFFGSASEEPAAMEILRQRYANGEIDAVTFQHMRERLEASYRRREHQSREGEPKD